MHDYDRAENITEPFFSNCMIEAFKAKLKNWKNVKIFHAPSKYNSYQGPHFYWMEKDKNGSVNYYEFKHCTNHILSRFYFKGTIRKFGREYLNAWRNLALQSYTKRIGKKFHFDTWENTYQKMMHSMSVYPIGLFNPDLADKEKKFVGVIKDENDAIIYKLFYIDEKGNIINSKKENIIGCRAFNEEIDRGFLPETYDIEAFKCKW